MNQLVIGNKKYSSWSLRPWLLLKQLGIPFEEIKIPLYQQNSKSQLLKYSPSGKVPAFSAEELTVWDSMAICETLAELYPDKNCWPKDLKLRSIARAVSYEMHSGFFEIRNQLPMNCKTSKVFENIDLALQADIDRISEIWRECRNRYSETGDFLFGEFSIADAMFAPIVLRFNSYGIKVGEVERQYMDRILALPSIQLWITDGCNEKEILQQCEI